MSFASGATKVEYFCVALLNEQGDNDGVYSSSDPEKASRVMRKMAWRARANGQRGFELRAWIDDEPANHDTTAEYLSFVWKNATKPKPEPL